MKFLYLLVCLISLITDNSYAYRKQNRPIFHPNKPIVGGSDAKIINFPFQISFQYYNEVPKQDNENEYQHFCGGTIISVEWVLSAAHCAFLLNAQGLERKNFWVRAGTSIKNEGGSLHQISDYIIHPEYKGDITSHNFDIALLKVKPPFEFSPTVQPIKLNNHPIETGGIVTVIGWGRTSMGGDKPLILQKVKILILPQWECEQIYEREGANITENMFCAGRAGKSACNGDSGGPVLYNGVQVGISSWTMSCQEPDYPVVYANVYNLRDWIHEHSGV